MTCYITSYYDINRENWGNQFSRTFDDYLSTFKPFITLFDKKFCGDDEMIVFIDAKHHDELHSLLDSKPPSAITLYPLTFDTMNELPMWRSLEREREIMKSEKFKLLLGERHIFPEHNYPEYTLINHCKIDIVCRVINLSLTDKDVLVWVDFGFFAKHYNIPLQLLDLDNFDLDRVNYTLINPIERTDFNIDYTLLNAPEVVGGFFFLGRKDKLLEYQSLYHEVLDYFQNSIEVADDDQHLVLQCVHRRPDLFAFDRVNYGWHKVLNAYQKKRKNVITFCLWGNEKRYTVGLIENIKLAGLYYPDWQCWCYIHEPTVNANFISIIQTFQNVRIILKKDPIVRPKRFMLWRLEPLMSTQIVERFISRDCDTRIQPREVLAVDEWIESGKYLHIMRDHPQHYPRMLGGMYGIKCSINFGIDWIEDVEKYYRENGEDADDQGYLQKTFYDVHTSEYSRCIHDEIKMYEEEECRPFPIPYEQNFKFVGCYVYEDGSGDVVTEKVLREYLTTNLPHRISEYPIGLEDKLKFIASKIKNIYIIHYTKLVKRKANMIRELRRNLLDKYIKINWVENFDREDISEEKIKESCVFNPDILPRFMTLAEIANGLAHIDTIEKIRDSGDELAIVLEDDTCFKKDFIHHFYYILNNLPKNFDSICLGGPVELQTVPCQMLEIAVKMDFKSEEIINFRPSTPAPMTLSAMLYNNEGVKKLISSQYFKPSSAPSDHSFWACNIDTRAKLFYCQPFITYEASKTELFDTSMDRGY